MAGAPAYLQTKKYSIHTRTVLLASQAPFVSIIVDLSKQSVFLLFTRTGFSLSNVVRRILGKQQKVPDFSSWFCQVKEYKMEWLFPMIEEERVYRQFFDECTHLSSWKI